MNRLVKRPHVAAAFLFLGCLAYSTIVLAAETGVPEQLVAQSGVRGGLVVHVAAGDIQQTAAIRVNDRFLVQRLDTDAQRISEARKQLRQKGLSGLVTVIAWRGKRLPYADNLVNLLIVDDGPRVALDEMMRVLAPRGVALVSQDRAQQIDAREQIEIGSRKWMKIMKPWPDDIDEWTHFLHGTDNNAVAEDTRVAPPHHLQWVAGPQWARSHDHLASLSAAVSAAGRLFYIIDEGPVSSVKEASKWMLVARDAFSGVLLWKKEIGLWEDQLRPFRSGPAELPRRLVAEGDRVYVTLGYGKPMTALDAATGEVVHSYAGTENTHEILYKDGKLYLVISDPLSQENGTTGEVIRTLSLWRDSYRRYVTRYLPKQIQCLEADTGELVWKKKDEITRHVLALTLAVSEGRVFFENEKQIVSLDGGSGKIVWQTDRPISLHRYAWSTPTLVVKDGVLLSADRSPDADLDTEGGDKTKLEWLVTANHLLTGGQIMAFSAESGEKLWEAPCHEGFNFPADVFVAHGKVWSGELAWKKQPGLTRVYDLHTGEVVAQRPPDEECYTIGFGHARCYRNKATTNYVLHGRSGVEFLDMNSNQIIADHWIRGACQYGILPCNGLLYVPAQSCACYITAKLSGFNALAASREPSDEVPETAAEDRLERGPASVRTPGPASSTADASTDWPTYRRDGLRSGFTEDAVSADLKVAWQTPLGGKLSSVVVAGGKLFVASVDSHTVHALDVNSGSVVWEYTVGGRVDSPPTIRGGFVYFGSADGWVYCLRALDGVLSWRYRAAPEARQIMSYEQLESVWPLHGNLLVHQDTDSSSEPVVYAVAGRSSFTDGGLFLYRLNATTGDLISQQHISFRDPDTGREPQETVRGVSMPGALPDILASDGESLFMRHRHMDMYGNPLPEDKDHVFSAAGFLDDAWWHRTYWQVGTTMGTGYGGWPQIGNRRISGRLLVAKGDRVFGFGRKAYSITGSHIGLESDFHLFCANTKLIQPKTAKGKQEKRRRGPATEVRYHWSQALPFYARAMLLAGDRLFVAGPNRVPDFAAQAPKGDVWLWAVSAADGAKQAEYRLKASPVFDSLVASNGALYFATVDGRVVCYQARQP